MNSWELRKLNLKEFVKLCNKSKEPFDLIDKTGGGTNSHYLKNQLREKATHMTVNEKNMKQIVNELNSILENYLIHDQKLESDIDDVMKVLGFEVEKKKK